MKILLNRRSFTQTRRPIMGRALYHGRCGGATFTSPNRGWRHKKDFIGTATSEPDAQGYVYINPVAQ